jgi:hypothetical protein
MAPTAILRLVRLWSVHPSYLDPAGLCGLWREALLAQAVIGGQRKGYRCHPQARRVLEEQDPPGAIRAYLRGVWEEGRRRGYRLDACRIAPWPREARMTVPRGQLEYELVLLAVKLEARAPSLADLLPSPENVVPHPALDVVEGGVAWWERPRADVLRRLEQGR